MVQFKGADKLAKRLGEIAKKEAIKKVVSQDTEEMGKLIQANAIFTRGYSTGATKASVGHHVEGDGLVGKSGPTTEYARYVEDGTYKMSPQPFVEPSHNVIKKKFIDDINRVMK